MGALGELYVKYAAVHSYAPRRGNMLFESRTVTGLARTPNRLSANPMNRTMFNRPRPQMTGAAPFLGSSAFPAMQVGRRSPTRHRPVAQDLLRQQARSAGRLRRQRQPFRRNQYMGDTSTFRQGSLRGRLSQRPALGYAGTLRKHLGGYRRSRSRV